MTCYYDRTLNKTFLDLFKLLFFRIQIADADYKKAFEDELIAFKDRIRRRAEVKIQEQLEEAREEEEEDRKARLGPGGLDPVEVFESLPDVGSTNLVWRQNSQKFIKNSLLFKI